MISPRMKKSPRKQKKNKNKGPKCIVSKKQRGLQKRLKIAKHTIIVHMEKNYKTLSRNKDRIHGVSV